jgi:hypothetical protein
MNTGIKQKILRSWGHAGMQSKNTVEFFSSQSSMM